MARESCFFSADEHKRMEQQLLRGGCIYPHRALLQRHNYTEMKPFDESTGLSAGYKLMQENFCWGPHDQKTTLLYTQPLVAMAEGGATAAGRAS